MSVRRRSIQARMRVELEQERGHHSFTKGILETYQKLSKQAIEENTALKSKLIAGFYEEEVPQFQQGEATHELQDLVTAEEVTGYVTHIKKLRDGLVRLRAGITEHATDTVWSGSCETAVDAITNLLGDMGP